MKTHFNPKYIDATLVLRDGTEFPVTECFERNPSTYDIESVRPKDSYKGIACFASGRSYWDGSQHLLTDVVMGASETFIARRFMEWECRP